MQWKRHKVLTNVWKMRAKIWFLSNFGSFPFIKVSHFAIVGGGSKHCLRAKKIIYTFLYGSLAQYKGQGEKIRTIFWKSSRPSQEAAPRRTLHQPSKVGQSSRWQSGHPQLSRAVLMNSQSWQIQPAELHPFPWQSIYLRLASVKRVGKSLKFIHTLY